MGFYHQPLISGGRETETTTPSSRIPISPSQFQSINFRDPKSKKESMAAYPHRKIQNPETQDEIDKEEDLFPTQDYSSEPSTVVVGNYFSMLRLDTTTPASSSASASTSHSIPNSNLNPVKSLKRRSPSDSPLISQPNPKKEKRSLPPTPIFRRCVSDPFHFGPPNSGTVTPPPQSPPDSGNKPTATVSASASTRNLNSKAVFRRSVSDVNPLPALKSISGSDDDDDDDSPSSKRLRRIKDRLREMSQWFQQVVLDEDHGPPEIAAEQSEEEEQQQLELEPSEDHQENEATATDQELCNYVVPISTELEDDCDTKFAESVRVENMDECLVLHFKCQCGVPYQFLLAGESCYYKLM